MGVCCYLNQERLDENQSYALVYNTFEEFVSTAAAAGIFQHFLTAINGDKSSTIFRNEYRRDVAQFLSNKPSKSKYQQITRQAMLDSCMILSPKRGKREPSVKESQMDDNQDQSFLQHVINHESMVMHMDIIFKAQFTHEMAYNRSVKQFLRWTEMAERHLTDGYLKKIYTTFASLLRKQLIQNSGLDVRKNLEIINQHIQVFINLLIKVYTKLYQIQRIRQMEDADLFNNQNLYNFALTNLFKIKKLTHAIKSLLKAKKEQDIQLFRNKLDLIKSQNIQYFQVPEQFICRSDKSAEGQFSSSTRGPNECFSESIRILKQIAQRDTPIGKLKILMECVKAISDQITKQHAKHNRIAPLLDPDTASSIINYVLARCHMPQLIVDLQIMDVFLTRNCQSCISGYYLKMFQSAVVYIMNLDKELP